MAQGIVGGSAWQTGFQRLAQLVEAALDGSAVSPRVDLFRPLPPDGMAWLTQQFPTYFQDAAGQPVAPAPHHHEVWDWFWRLRPGVPQETLMSILARGGGKSTMMELGATVVGYFGLRRYALYVSDTQKQADDHVANVGAALESLRVDRAINRYGFSRGWNINRLRTADGFTLDAIGMDAAARGLRIDADRPDLIILDDLDDQLDTGETIAKKIDILTRKILPTGSAALTVVGVQNIPHKDGIFAQLADGRAHFLLDRRVVGPYPALRDLPEQDWYRQEVAPDGALRLRLTAGVPVWEGQGLQACERWLNLLGPRGFLIECQHRIALLQGDLFQREWFHVVDDWPRGALVVRAWDFASSDPAHGGRDPDWTVGLLVGLWRGQFWVLDMQRVRKSPKVVEDLVRQSAALDGRGVDIWLEEEGGSSGKTVTADYRLRVLLGYSVFVWHPTGAKAVRAKPMSSAAEAGNVFVVRGAWNGDFLDELCQFGLPGVHDDILDALTLAHYALTSGQGGLLQGLDLTLGMGRMQLAGLPQRAQAHAGQVATLGAWRTAFDDDEEPVYG